MIITVFKQIQCKVLMWEQKESIILYEKSEHSSDHYYYQWLEYDEHTVREKGNREENWFAVRKRMFSSGTGCLIDWRLVLDVKQR